MSSLNPNIPTIHKSIVDRILTLDSPTILRHPPTHPKGHHTTKGLFLSCKPKGVTSPLTIHQNLWFP